MRSNRHWSIPLLFFAALLLMGCPERLYTILYPNEQEEYPPRLSVGKNRETGHITEAFNYRRDSLLFSVYGQVENRSDPPAISLDIYIFNRGSAPRTLSVEPGKVTVSGCQTERRPARLSMSGGFAAQRGEAFTVGEEQAYLVFRFVPVECPDVASRTEHFTFDLDGVRIESEGATHPLPAMTFVTED